MTPFTPVVLDTDILSAVMRQHPVVTAKAHDYLRVHGQLTFSVITRYEILRGLKAKRATTQVVAFDRFCTANRILALSDAIILEAAEIYADLYRRGELIGDADILIAASAIVHGLVVSTNNESHFGRIRGLRVENWLT